MNPFKAARVALGATQQEVADATGVARSTIASLETGIGIDPQTRRAAPPQPWRGLPYRRQLPW